MVITSGHQAFKDATIDRTERKRITQTWEQVTQETIHKQKAQCSIMLSSADNTNDNDDVVVDDDDDDELLGMLLYLF